MIPLVIGLIAVIIILFVSNKNILHLINSEILKLHERINKLELKNDFGFIGVIEVNKEQVIVDVNQSFTNILGWTRAELIGKRVSILIPTRFMNKHNDGFKKVVNGEISLDVVRQVPILDRDGKEVMVSIYLAKGNELFAAIIKKVL